MLRAIVWNPIFSIFHTAIYVAFSCNWGVFRVCLIAEVTAAVWMVECRECDACTISWRVILNQTPSHFNYLHFSRRSRAQGATCTSTTGGGRGALVQWLKLPVWKVGDHGFEPRSVIQVSKKQNISSRSLLKIHYCGELPWPRGSVFCLRARISNSAS